MLNVYCFKNVRVGFYENPFYSAIPKEGIIVEVTRALMLDKEKAKQSHREECELYYLGQFDDQRGVFALEDDKEFLIDCAPIFKE